MASADLRDELTCSICLNIYTDPVTLPCGHSFCRTCIGDVLDTQEASGVYKCPECRAESQERPALVKNRKLRNIAENIRSTHPEQEEAGIPCTYCDSPVPAAKTCLHCEDAACICVYCMAGEHRGHQVETLNEASEKKKEKLRNILQKLTSQREEAEKRVQNLEELRRQVQGNAAGVTERVTALIRDIRKQLEALEKRVLSEISRQEEQVSPPSLRSNPAAGNKEGGAVQEDGNCLTRTGIRQRRLLCGSDLSDLTLRPSWDCDRITRRHRVPEASDMLLDVNTASDMLLDVNTASDMLLDVNTASDMLLDVNTAGRYVSVSEDLKTVSGSGINQGRPETPERFQVYPQVLSSRSFSSGRHYWEVEGSESGEWGVGMTYPSIERRGGQSLIGENNKSWGLEKIYNKVYYMRHDSKLTQLPHSFSCCRFGIFLDYEAGRLSFYELCDPIRHLHTFTAAFTEPLHAGFGVYEDNTWVRI
uniref:Uncharacterized protein n=1 Tax=Leptobrachium leishanense TaxID=445787 RepID=A0A8C5PZE8_9ANUR